MLDKFWDEIVTRFQELFAPEMLSARITEWLADLIVGLIVFVVEDSSF